MPICVCVTSGGIQVIRNTHVDPEVKNSTKQITIKCPSIRGAGRSASCFLTHQKKVFLHSRRRPAALWPGWSVRAAWRGPPPWGPTAEWSPHTAPPAWGPACSQTASHSAQFPPTSDRRSLKHKIWWYDIDTCQRFKRIGIELFCFHPIFKLFYCICNVGFRVQ